MLARLRSGRGRRAALLAISVVAVNAAIALSDRAAELWGRTSDSINGSSEVVAEVVASTGVTRSEGDWAVHSVLWAVGAMLAVLLVSRRRHLVGVLAGFAAAGVALEILQNLLTSERSAQAGDIVGNLLGLTVGSLLGAAVLRWSAGAGGAAARGVGD